MHCLAIRKKREKKSFFKYLRHEGLGALSALHLKDNPENNLKLAYCIHVEGREGFKPLGLDRGSSSKCWGLKNDPKTT